METTEKPKVIFKRVYANHSKNHKTKQLLLCIPLQSGIQEKDFVKVEKVEFSELPDDIKKKYEDLLS